MKRATLLSGAFLAALTTAATASDRVTGTATTFKSPNGVEERCVRITPIPGGEYSRGDTKDEEAFCAIDLYSTSVALCPKTWSTSAGTMVYDISSGNYANARAEFERNACSEGKSDDFLPQRNIRQVMHGTGIYFILILKFIMTTPVNFIVILYVARKQTFHRVCPQAHHRQVALLNNHAPLL